MSRFEGTIQLALGVRNFKYSFDIMDNPYIKVQLGHAKTEWDISFSSDTFLRKCTEEEAFSHNGVWASLYSDNMVCLDDPTKLKIHSNWYEGEYDTPYFMIVECQNSTSNTTCETTENIEDFVRNMEVNFFK